MRLLNRLRKLFPPPVINGWNDRRWLGKKHQFVRRDEIVVDIKKMSMMLATKQDRWFPLLLTGRSIGHTKDNARLGRCVRLTIDRKDAEDGLYAVYRPRYREDPAYAIYLRRYFHVRLP